jgi:SNF2 family DNA or RNA helicase
MYTVHSGGVLLDPGMGKSKVILDYIKLMNFNLSFIVCPVALLFVWEDEIEKHRPELRYHTVKSTDWEEEVKHIKALPPNSVVIINYTKVVLLKHRIKETKIDFIHLDEFLIKDSTTSRTQSILEISKGIPYRCGGSGTLINNSPLDLYSPVRYLQPSLVGSNYGNFMNEYCVMVDVKQAGGVVRKRPVAPKNIADMRAILESCCIVMTKEKWLKLPKKTTHNITVQMGPDQKQAYYQLARNYYLNYQGREFNVDNPLVMLSKLYQISQGFIYSTQDDQDIEDLLPGDFKEKKGKRETLFFESQPKSDALRKLITETILGKRSIIWFNLSAELKLIEEVLISEGKTYLVIQGGEKKIGDKVRLFNKNPNIDYLVCQSKSVNYGITVLGSKKKDLEDEGVSYPIHLDPSVHTEIFYSLNFSLEVLSQQEDRIHRLGQDHDCDYYRIFANNPVEAKILKALSDKLEMRREMLVDVAESILENIKSDTSWGIQ